MFCLRLDGIVNDLSNEQLEMLKRAAERPNWDLTELCPIEKLSVAQSLAELSLIEGRCSRVRGAEGGVWITLTEAGREHLEAAEA